MCSGLSPAFVYAIEAGRSGSAEAAARIAAALGRRAELKLVDPRKRETRPSLSADPVHSAMGELEAAHFAGLGFRVGIDEPYQHYQFAGRADLVAWDVDARALLHIENRTRFPDFQEMAGAFNAKREYLADSLATRAGVTCVALTDPRDCRAVVERSASRAQTSDGELSGAVPRLNAGVPSVVGRRAGQSRCQFDAGRDGPGGRGQATRLDFAGRRPQRAAQASRLLGRGGNPGEKRPDRRGEKVQVVG